MQGFEYGSMVFVQSIISLTLSNYASQIVLKMETNNEILQLYASQNLFQSVYLRFVQKL